MAGPRRFAGPEHASLAALLPYGCPLCRRESWDPEDAVHSYRGCYLLLEPGGPVWRGLRQRIVAICRVDKRRTDP